MSFFVDKVINTGGKTCLLHNFTTHSDILLDQHFRSLPHYGIGRNGVCSNPSCRKIIDKFLIPYKTLSKPANILCDDCKNRMNYALETLQDTKLFKQAFDKRYYP